MKMKPIDLLSKIEEAAGTALYETRRTETINTLEKKESKLREI
jgi:structural maintenance of chromosome 2